VNRSLRPLVRQERLLPEGWDVSDGKRDAIVRLDLVVRVGVSWGLDGTCTAAARGRRRAGRLRHARRGRAFAELPARRFFLWRSVRDEGGATKGVFGEIRR